MLYGITVCALVNEDYPSIFYCWIGLVQSQFPDIYLLYIIHVFDSIKIACYFHTILSSLSQTYYDAQEAISTGSDCCTIVPKIFGKLPENTISRTIRLRIRGFFRAQKNSVQNVSSWSQVSQSIIVASAQGIVV